MYIPHMEYPVYGIEKNKSLRGKADMVLDKRYELEVYEIKPYWDRPTGNGRVQLQGYVDALNKTRSKRNYFLSGG